MTKEYVYANEINWKNPWKTVDVIIYKLTLDSERISTILELNKQKYELEEEYTEEYLKLRKEVCDILYKDNDVQPKKQQISLGGGLMHVNITEESDLTVIDNSLIELVNLYNGRG